MSTSVPIGFIGSGNMAEAILRGIINEPWCDPSSVFISDVRPERVQELCDELGVQGCENNVELVQKCGPIILAVKPQNIKPLLQEIKSSSRPDHVFISILAGITSHQIERGLMHPNNMGPRVVRVMPNTPALIKRGVTAWCLGANADEECGAITAQFFQNISLVEQVDEHLMDAVTGLTGSGPAYVFRFMEALIEAGIAQGLPKESVPRMVAELVAGSAELALQSDVTPGVLRERVTSPNGTTAAGLAFMNEHNFKEVIIGGVNAATERSKQLAAEQS